MPAKYLRCPDGENILIEECLEVRGCRMYPHLSDRCAPLPYLRKISFDRQFTGVSPSMAGNGPRLMGLKAIVPYVIVPDDRAFAVLGTTFHGRMAEEGVVYNVLSEETMSDEAAKGTPDLLEKDEHAKSGYILTDYKSSGSFKVCKWLGIYVQKTDVPILDDNGVEVRLKSGKNKGQVKTKVHREIIEDPVKIDKLDLELQVNRYRIFFEKNGFPINKMRAFCVPRDGGTHIAKSRGLLSNTRYVPVSRYEDSFVLDYYAKLTVEIDDFFRTHYARLCDTWENWEGRRCAFYCEVKNECKEMCIKHNEKWPGDGKVPEPEEGEGENAGEAD